MGNVKHGGTDTVESKVFEAGQVEYDDKPKVVPVKCNRL